METGGGAARCLDYHCLSVEDNSVCSSVKHINLLLLPITTCLTQTGCSVRLRHSMVNPRARSYLYTSRAPGENKTRRREKRAQGTMDSSVKKNLAWLLWPYKSWALTNIRNVTLSSRISCAQKRDVTLRLRISQKNNVT